MANGEFRGLHRARRRRSRADRLVDVRANGVTEASPSRTPARPAIGASFRLHVGEGLAPRMAIAIGLSLLSAALLVAMSGHNPLAAFAAMAMGAVGSPHQIGVALNRATPYLLAGGGVAICFRAGVINIGAEGQIALGGAGAAAVALHWPDSASALTAVAALLGAAAFGALWAALATAIHLGRRVHEVLVTLLLNFVALLLVQQSSADRSASPAQAFCNLRRCLPRRRCWQRRSSARMSDF